MFTDVLYNFLFLITHFYVPFSGGCDKFQAYRQRVSTIYFNEAISDESVFAVVLLYFFHS